MQPIELTVLDMAGTTVTDDGLVLHAFDAAATALGVPDTGAERDVGAAGKDYHGHWRRVARPDHEGAAKPHD